MARRCPAAMFTALAFGSVACRPAPSPAVDSEVAACIPSDTQVLVGIRLDSLRASPAFQRVAAGWMPLLEPFRNATSLLVAYNGNDFLLIAGGQFPAAPAGAVQLTPQIALSGPTSAVRAATAQHARGKTGAPSLLAEARLVNSRDLWAVAPGTARLPVKGNGANLMRLLAFTDYVTVTAEWNREVALEAAGFCRSASSAESLEEALRGLVSLAAGTSRDRDLARLLASVQIRREALTVRAQLSATPEAVEILFREAAR